MDRGEEAPGAAFARTRGVAAGRGAAPPVRLVRPPADAGAPDASRAGRD